MWLTRRKFVKEIVGVEVQVSLSISVAYGAVEPSPEPYATQ